MLRPSLRGRAVLAVVVLASTGCPPESEPPPPIPTRVDEPPPTPFVPTCDLPATDLPFSASWSPVTFAPDVPDGPAELRTGTLRVPTDWGLDVTDLEVFGVPATVTDVAEDGADTTAAWSVTAACTGRCTWTEATIGTLRLTSVDTALSPTSTAYVALDLGSVQAAARTGATGLAPADQPVLDAAIPSVEAAMLARYATSGDLGVGVGGAAEPGTAVFSAIDDALADATVPAPAVPNDLAWSLSTLTAPAGARLVVTDGQRISLPIEPADDGALSWHPTAPGIPGATLVFRWLFEDGRQSPAQVATWGPTVAGPAPQVLPGDGDTVQVDGADPDAWVLLRSNTVAGLQAACRADATGTAVLSADPTTGFSVLTLDDDLSVTSLQGCTWMDGEPECGT
jgi:hypothetical protein